MKKKKELPLIDPIYSTYHHAPGSAILVDNPSIRNFYLNEVMNLKCNRRFLSGYTTPSINVLRVNVTDNPYLESIYIPMRFLGGYIHPVIRNLIDEGYYVNFNGVDDYYVDGKSWYQERHFNHDGCICGYNQEDKTYCIYSYDKNRLYRKFWTPQKSFDNGRKSAFRQGTYGNIRGLKPKSDHVEFSSKQALYNICIYLDSNIEKYPENEEGDVYGIVVHDYIAMYVGKLYDGSIPHEKMDRRVFRLIWEHKKAMIERIRLIENELSLDNSLSEAYKSVVRESDNCRMLYATHHMKQHNSFLPIIQKKLLALKALEQEILQQLIETANKAKGETT